MSKLRLVMLTALVALLAIPVGVAFAQDEAVTEGTAVVWDDVALSDAITYALTDVPAPPDGTEYVGWLISDDSSVKLSTGPMVLADDGTLTHTFDSDSNRYTGENLIQSYSTVAITAETTGADPDAPGSDPVFVDQVPVAAMAHIRHLLSDWPDGSGVGILTNVKLQLEVALEQAVSASGAADLAGIKTSIQKAINVIEGPAGANYDATVDDPGDGIGVVAHTQAREHASLAAGTVPGDEVVTANADNVNIAGANAEAFALQARDNAVDKVLTQTDEALAKLRLGGVTSLLESALGGVDRDADGAIEYVGGDEAEAATAQAYTAAQAMATYSFGAAAAPPVEIDPTGDPTVPMLAQIALLAAMALMVAGGATMLLSRRSRSAA